MDSPEILGQQRGCELSAEELVALLIDTLNLSTGMQISYNLLSQLDSALETASAEDRLEID